MVVWATYGITAPAPDMAILPEQGESFYGNSTAKAQIARRQRT
jgi:hypothetical protein